MSFIFKTRKENDSIKELKEFLPTNLKKVIIK